MLRTMWLVISGALLGICAGALVAVLCPIIAVGCVPAGIINALREERRRKSPADLLAEELDKVLGEGGRP